MYFARNQMCEKPSISKLLIRRCFDRKPKFLDEILGILFEILRFQIEIQSVSKICGICIPYISYV